MQTRSKVVELSSRKFEIRRLSPEIGSFIFMRMLGVSMRTAAVERESKPASAKEEKESEPAPEISGEMKVRALTFSVFSGGMGFEDFKFIQNGCMRVVSVVENRAGIDFPLPIMDDAGKWTPDGISLSFDVGLVMRLTTEVLIFCFADFFEGSGLGL